MKTKAIQDLEKAKQHLNRELREAESTMGRTFVDGPGMFNVRRALAYVERAEQALRKDAKQ